MIFWLGVLAVAVGLMISIALHEIGHLVPAKRFGVRVPQYFVGFGPTLWSRRRGETEYGVKALPLGGFVRMIGMFPPGRAVGAPDGAPEAVAHPAESDAVVEERLRRRGIRGWFASVADDARAVSAEEIEPGDEGRAFYELSVPKKLTVMFGGPFVNFLISAVLLAIAVLGIGLPTATTTLNSVIDCVEPTGDSGECTDGDPTSPAAAAGLQPDDVITSWGGTPVSSWTDLTTAIEAGGTSTTDVVVTRGGSPTTLQITPVEAERTTTTATGDTVTEVVPYIGIAPTSELERQSVGLWADTLREQLVGTVEIVATLPQRLASIAQAVFGDAERDPSVMGLIGVGRAAGELNEAAAPEGFAAQALNLLMILSALNMALFVFNLIPLPPLDGGHIAGALYEGARRQLARLRKLPRPGFADTAKLMPLTYGVVVLMFGMFVLLAIADIVDPISLI